MKDMFGNEVTDNNMGPLFGGKNPTVDIPKAKTPEQQTTPMASCHVCMDTGYVLYDGRYITCTCLAGSKNTLIKTCMALSDGTYASVSGYSRYTEIDRIRVALIQFVTDHGDGSWTWQRAWNEFAAQADLSVYADKHAE